jgi:hypothetical protein
MIDAASLDAREAAQLTHLEEWIHKTSEALPGKLRDAEAHAQKALTDVVVSAPDGRPTLAKVRQSRSYQAALARMDEIRDALLKIVHEARVAFYRDSWAFWNDTLPAEVLKGAEAPAEARIAKARTAVIHGQTAAGALAAATQTAKRQLLASLAQAGSRVQTGKGAAEILKAWRTRAEKALSQHTTTLLSDSQIDADRRAGRDVVKDELLHEDPTL